MSVDQMSQSVIASEAKDLTKKDGQVRDLSEELVLIKTNKHTIDAVVDRLVLRQRSN